MIKSGLLNQSLELLRIILQLLQRELVAFLLVGLWAMLRLSLLMVQKRNAKLVLSVGKQHIDVEVINHEDKSSLTPQESEKTQVTEESDTLKTINLIS